jgi:hypothetical protein
MFPYFSRYKKLAISLWICYITPCRFGGRTKERKKLKKFLQSNRLMWYIDQVAFEGRRIKTKEIDL